MELPTHPEADDPPAGAGPTRPRAPSSRWSTVLVAALLGLVAVVVALHLTGVVGPGGS